MQPVRVQLQPGRSVATNSRPIATGSHLVAISLFSQLQLIIDVVFWLQLQGGCILYRECTLLHFSPGLRFFGKSSTFRE